jgi:hypothetical protein
MKRMQLTITHEESCDMNRFAKKVSGWSGFGMRAMRVAVVSPELSGGLYGLRGVAAFHLK